MQRIINNCDEVVEDMLKGFERCHHDLIRVDENNPRVVISKEATKKRRLVSLPEAAVGINQRLSAIAERIWSMPWPLVKFSLLLRQNHFTMLSVRLIKAWALPACMAITPVIT